ncbi:CehA/McbA family metallohydrolase [Paenibacillus chartarius]|uniref:CehA/McbA family metallohydrolase n=1 Tax=Paenibacillus chartarius TaxID=747481 RepID=A0ABV6DQX9_9BACL
MKFTARVCNEKKEAIFCRIHVYAISNCSETPRENNKATVYCNGEYVFELAPGEYGIEITKGKLFSPVKVNIQMAQDDVVLETVLTEIIDTKRLGLYSFDAHSHVSRSLSVQTGNLEYASTVMKGEDYHFFFAGSPYDQETHREDIDVCYNAEVSYRERFSDVIAAANNDSFILDIGNEIVKCRYGHMFIMNYDQKPPFSQYYDRAWDPWLFTKIGDEPRFMIPYPYEALRRERGRNSVAVAAHPTSWWFHEGEFISNIAATLGFEILAESIDAMVIMGYDRDHRYYQSLWYDALNNGYFMPGVAETDHTFDTNQTKYLEFKTYTYLEDFTIDALCTSVKAGRNIVSSGPIVLLSVNGQLPGAVLNYQAGEEFRVRIEAFPCCEAPLHQVQLIVNGEVWKEYSVNEERIEVNEITIISQDSYILAKCYDAAGNVAIANPVYIKNTPFVNRDFKSDLTVKVMKDGEPADGRFWIDDDPHKTAFSKEITSKISVAAEVNIEVEGTVKTVKLFEMDELQSIFRNLYFGYFNRDRRYRAGEVPAEYFELSRIRSLLSKVDLHVRF